MKKLFSLGMIFLLLVSLVLSITPASAEEKELYYDDGSADFGFVAAPGAIAAVKFVCNSSHPCQVLKLMFFVWGEMKPVYVKVLDLNFTPIFSLEVTPYEGWFEVDISYANIIVNGWQPFYIGLQWISEPSRPWLGVDTTPPHHEESYLGTVGNPGSPKSSEDYMIRVSVKESGIKAQGILQHFDLDYHGSPPNSDGNDQHLITVSAGAILTLFFYYRESDAGNNYIIRVYPEWDKDHFIANSDGDESYPEDGREIGGFRWDKEAYTVPCTAGTYKIRVVYSASTKPPTWDSYDRLLAEGTVTVQAALPPTTTAYITKLLATTTTIYLTETIKETYVSVIASERTLTEQTTLTLERWYTVTHTVTLTTQLFNTISVLALLILIPSLIFLLYLILVRKRRTVMKESSPAKTLTDELLRKAKLIELDRLRAEGRISEEAYRRLREEYEEERKK